MMHSAIAIASAYLWLASLGLASHFEHARSLNGSIEPQVDLGYTVYNGVMNTTTSLSTFKG